MEIKQSTALPMFKSVLYELYAIYLKNLNDHNRGTLSASPFQ